MQVWDAIVIGAGCAGLTLVNELITRGGDRLRVLLLEERNEYTNDRTWCFWNTLNHRFENVVSCRWPSWSVHYAGEVTHCRGAYQYQYLRAEHFYKLALAPVSSSSKTILKLGEHVQTVQEEEDLVSIQTHQGTHVGRYVIDTRPMDQQNRNAKHPDVHWLQHFLGWKVKTEHACFQSKQVTLMDFIGGEDAAEVLEVSDKETDVALPGIPFIYVLPFSSTEALVESTWFGPKVLAKSVYREQLQRYLQRKEAGKYEIIEQEYGVLPMSTLPTTTQPTRRIRYLGLAGGAARPSTGYAFLAIQRQAQRLADQLLKGDWENFPDYYSTQSRLLDAIFLRVLQENPKRGPELFWRLFRYANPDALVRFLADTASLKDLWEIATCLPSGIFLKQSLVPNFLQKKEMGTTQIQGI
ncbi:MAG: lycopene cyclase family protein [SAR324 cluster bacterium]|nr:lycopene cyclase family protein [SAR324 cluster bacterium]